MAQTQSQKSTRIRRTKKQIAESDEFFAKEVQKNKDLLFGPFSPSITAVMKDDKWEEIRMALVDKGDKLLANKNATYMKTSHWQLVRKRTIEKVDALKVTTGSEPKDEELSPIDKIILDIIGKEVAEGLDEPDSIEALELKREQDENEEEVDLLATASLKPNRKRRKAVTVSSLEQAKIRALNSQASNFDAQARTFDAQTRLMNLQADILEEQFRNGQKGGLNEESLYNKFMY